MFNEFKTGAKKPIYDPLELRKFCVAAGAPKIFDAILDCMTSDRQSETRFGINQKRTVFVLYTLCYGLSQVCNWLQSDNTLFLHHSNFNQDGLDTIRQMGGSCSRRFCNEMINSLSDSNPKKISEMIDQAIKERWQLVLIIDDYTTIHTRRRPTTTERPSVSKPMCTIILKFFKTIKALPACTPTDYHCLQAIDIEACVNTVSGPVSMHKLSLTYSSTMPPWIKKKRSLFLSLRDIDFLLINTVKTTLWKACAR